VNRRLRPLVFGSVTVALCSTTIAFACDKNHSSTTNTTAAKTTTKSTTTKGTTATYAVAGAQGSCSYKAGTTTAANTASASCAAKNTAVAASAGSACCASKGAKASTTTAAKTASSKSDASCHSEDANAAGFDAVLTGGGQCNGKGVTTMAGRPSHSACDACSDMAMCEDELKTAGSQFQVVPLKNGVMYVYTANNSKGVHAVQTAIARRSERINSLVSATKANLCPDCKSMRGALASGKLTREVVNVEGGSISLVTSNDPAIVAKLYAMAGLENSKVVKS
jgi:hypothetical protein